MKSWLTMTTPIIRKAFNDFWEDSGLEIVMPEIYEKVRDAFYKSCEANREDLVMEKELSG